MGTSLALACRLGAGSPVLTIPRRVRSILNKYGATMLMPGPSGILQYGFQPGNYRESTGQTLAAADQQVGLVVDAARVPGPECAIYAHETWSAAGGAYTKSVLAWGGVGGSNLTVGKTYLMSFTVAAITAGSSLGVYRRNAANTGNELVANINVVVGGSYSVVVPVVTDLSTYDIWVDNNTFNGTLTNFSVRELPGIHAAQATSGYQPYLRQVPKTLGPELVSNGTFDSADGWSMGTGWSISGGALNHTAPSTLTSVLTTATQAGKTYQCTYSVTAQSAAGSGVSLRLGNTNLTIRNAVGTYSETLAQTADSTTVGFIARGGSGDWLGSIDNVSVREVLDWTYAWQFDGVDDRLSLSAVPFLITDDFWAVCAYTNTNAAGDAKLLSLRSTTDVNPLIELAIEGRNPILQVRNNAGILSKISSPAVPVSAPAVVSAVKQASTANLRVDGVQNPSSINLSSIGALTLNGAAIGSSGSGTPAFFLEGRMHGLAIGKGGITPTELLTLENFIARMQGRNL